MKTLSQSPVDPDFVQNPYAFYESAVEQSGPMFHWPEYDMTCAMSYAANWAILKDRRFGREIPEAIRTEPPTHQRDFWKVEDHSLLQLEPPSHTRLRGLVLRAFTSRRIKAMTGEIEALAQELIDGFKGTQIDLIPSFAEQFPVRIIARLLGIPENRSNQLLSWSHDMVGMYQARRTEVEEIAAAKAAQEFSDSLTEHVNYKRKQPGDDLITHLIAAEEDGEKLTTPELISTCILLLNAGHEATVHTIGNGVKAFLENGTSLDHLSDENMGRTVEEILRYDPPLHMFTRYAYDDVDLGTVTIPKNSEIACMLGAANRDASRWDRADRFDPGRAIQTNVSFGAGVHFCLGAPLARLELQVAIPALFARHPKMALVETPKYANLYHFHGLEELQVNLG